MFRKKTAPKNVYFDETKPIYNVMAYPCHDLKGYWWMTCEQVGAISQARNLDEALEAMQELIYVKTTKQNIMDIDFNNIPPSQIVMHVQSYIGEEQNV